MKAYGQQQQVKTLDFTGDTTYVNHPDLFFDATHLNDKGARLFTKKFINNLR